VDKKQEVNLAELLDKLSDEVGITLGLDPGNLVLGSDPALLRSVFLNLLLNSKEAGANRVITTFKKKKNKDIEILFQDNGKGIDAEVKEKIWYPFFTTKEKGTGMGLAIIRKIVNTLKGEISLAETGPGGTTFKIIFYG
jgi:signal transduction histidine kinase